MTLAPSSVLLEISSEGITPSGRAAEKLSLPTLQSKMKCDPEGYQAELSLIYGQFKSSVELFEQQAALSFTSVSGIGADPTVAKDLGDRAMFLAHMTESYPEKLSDFPKELTKLLRSSSRSLPSGLRVHVTRALILSINNRLRSKRRNSPKVVDIGETLTLFMELQTLGDKVLRNLAFSHVVHSIKQHKNDRSLQNILFMMLKQEDEAKAKRALITLCELHRRQVWFDDRTADAICMACFHTSSKIMIAGLSFLLDYEKIEDDDDSDESDSKDDRTTQQPQVVLNKEAIYKANHKGTAASKKKKKAKLQRVIRSMKKQQRLSSDKNNNGSYYSPLKHLKDAQGFAEKLLGRLQSCNERFETKMMMVKVIARTVGLHHLILLNFYPYVQKYIQPHQRDVTNLLAAAVQACHDMVPPDAVEPMFRQIVNQFVHDRSRPEAISVGLNAVREICLRMPLLMTEDLLQDLVLYKKSHEKAVSSAARSLITLFREVCPSLLIKKDRGRPADLKARPKAFGEVHVASNVPGVELLEHEDDGSDHSDGDEPVGSSDDGQNEGDDGTVDEYGHLSDKDNETDNENDNSSEDNVEEDEGMSIDDDDDDDNNSIDEANNIGEENEDASEEELDGRSDDGNNHNDDVASKKSKPQKRKFSDFEGQLNAASNSIRALKKLASAKAEKGWSSDMEDGILSNEDFRRIKEEKAKIEARSLLAQQGFKLPSSDQLSSKRVDAAKLEVNIRRKYTKQERLEMVRAGREERGTYQAKTKVKRKKTGGSTNRQKQHKKAMPLAAKRDKIAKTRLEKKKKKQRSGKQFRGRKAWK